MSARTFTDSIGARWEVFEVHRVSRNAGAVSAGLEGGWLSFVGEAEKRRLAPFPPDWEVLGEAELASLCERARRASPTRIVRTPPTATSAGGTRIDISTELNRAEDRGAPRTIVVDDRRGREATGDDGHATDVSDTDGVERVVRDFTHHARASGTPAIETMIRLRAALQERFPGEHPVARDMRRIRRWFVDAYYFERDEGTS